MRACPNPTYSICRSHNLTISIPERQAHNSIATPTMLTIVESIPVVKLPVLAANPVCTPGAAVPVRVLEPAPASPVGVGLSSSPGTTVTAVTVDLLPSGNVVVRTIKLDFEAGLLATEARDETEESKLEAIVDEGGATVPIVDASPPTVVITTMPEESVKVYTDPAERDGGSVDDAGEGTSEVISGASSVLVEVMEAGRVAESGLAVDFVFGMEGPLSLVLSAGPGVIEVCSVVKSTVGVGDSVGGVVLVNVAFKLS